MLVATTTFLESGGEGSKTCICSVIVRPECRAIGLRCSLFVESLFKGTKSQFSSKMS
jgi:hypothetical protein